MELSKKTNMVFPFYNILRVKYKSDYKKPLIILIKLFFIYHFRDYFVVKTSDYCKCSIATQTLHLLNYFQKMRIHFYKMYEECLQCPKNSSNV